MRDIYFTDYIYIYIYAKFAKLCQKWLIVKNAVASQCRLFQVQIALTLYEDFHKSWLYTQIYHFQDVVDTVQFHMLISYTSHSLRPSQSRVELEQGESLGSVFREKV